MTDTPSSLSLADANRQLFTRYAALIAAQDSPDLLGEDPRLSQDNLAWMCAEGARLAGDMPDDKASRWLGFIQGCLAMRRLIDVDAERDITRPLFHAAARARGIDPGPTRAREGGSSDGV
jgi:hypothetical protein